MPIGSQGIGASSTKTKSAFVATQTTKQESRSSHSEHFDRPEMMIIRLPGAAGAFLCLENSCSPFFDLAVNHDFKQDGLPRRSLLILLAQLV